MEKGKVLRRIMSTLFRHGLAAMLGAAVLTTGSPAARAAADSTPAIPPAEAPASLAYQTVPCDPNGPTAADAALASQLILSVQPL
jgi:hypothetical protein